MIRKARFPIGLSFMRSQGRKVARQETITDILITKNSKDEIVRIEYEVSHVLLGQQVTELVVDTTIARNLDPKVLAQFS